MTIDLFYPIPEYDWKATEHWLEKKARRGWRLLPGGNLSGLAAFEKTAPADIRYRLIPAQRKWTESEDKLPPPEAIHLHEQMGWTYLTNRGCFHIYCCENPSAPEPDTDPQVLAMALKPALKRAVLDTIFWLLFIAIQITRVPVLETAISRNNPMWLLFPIPLALAGLSRLASCVRLLWYRRVCSTGQFPDHKRRQYLPDNLLLAACLTLVLVNILGADHSASTPPREIYDDYVLHEAYEWPFRVPGATVEQTDAVSFTTFATRENWGYDGYIILPDGNQGDIYIDFADFRSELLAKWYAWELKHYCRSDQFVRHGTQVWHIHGRVTLDDPESIFLPEGGAHHG